MTSDVLYDAPELDPYKQFRGPGNPYGIYNNQDRFLNAVYRAYTTGELEKLYVKHLDSSVGFNLASFKYESQTNMLSQHFWATTALLGVGYSLNLQGLGNGSSEQSVVAALTLTRSVVNAGLEGALLIGNGFRWSSSLNPATRPVAAELSDAWNKYSDKIKFARTAGGAGASFAFSGNALISVGMSAKLLASGLQSNDPVKAAVAAMGLGASVANASANFLKGLNSVGSLRGWTSATNKGLGIGGSVFGALNGVLNIASIAPLLARKDLTSEQRAVLIAEMGGQVAGGAVQIISNMMLASAVARGFTTGAQVVGPAVGAAAGALVLALSPLEIYGLVKQSQYADNLEELGREMSQYGYEGDSMLGQLYRDKTAAEGSIVAATSALAIIGSAVSIAAAASVVGTPVAVIVGLATAAISGILKGVQQPILEAIATDYATKIVAQGGAFAFFDKNLSARHQQLIESPESVARLQELQKIYQVDSIVGVSGSRISKTALELAAITQNTADLRTSNGFVDRFNSGQLQPDRSLQIDPAEGVLAVTGVAGSRQLLTFLSPLMAPGIERRTRIQKGKNEYVTGLEIALKGSWSISDGAANTAMDFRGVVSRYVDSQGALSEIQLVVSCGAGNDTIFGAAAAMNVEGGAGDDLVSYEQLGSENGISVVPTASGFTVVKHLRNVDVYCETVGSENYTYGKRSETVAYRDISVTKLAGLIGTDTLGGVERISGSQGDDSLTGNDAANVLSGGGGNDVVDGGAGDDMLAGGDGNDTLFGGAGADLMLQTQGSDQLDGGDGIDTANYSGIVAGFGTRAATAILGIHADLASGIVDLDMSANDATNERDRLQNIENVVGSELNDVLSGDHRPNMLAGGGGDDVLNGQQGDDVLSGGKGNDTLLGGDGDDVIMQEVAQGLDVLDGGAGNDTASFSASALTGSQSELGVSVDLDTGTIYEFHGEEGITYDTVRNVENLVGTSLQDTLRGNGEVNQLAGGDGNDVLEGRGGDDVLSGGAGADTLRGGDGNDQLVEEIDAVVDVVDGGDGIDTFSYNDAQLPLGQNSGMYADLAEHFVQNYVNAKLGRIDTILNIENIRGTLVNDMLFGDAQNNWLEGGSGDDLLSGRAGNDVLIGGASELGDEVYGGDGDDRLVQDIERHNERLDGGAGSDVLDYSTMEFPGGERAGMGGVGIVADLRAGRVYKFKGLDDEIFDAISSIESLIGTVLNDVVDGDDGSNLLAGEGGDDLLRGWEGNDLLTGGSGNDTLLGGAGDDVLAGGQGVDQFDGGDGDDTVYQNMEHACDTIDGGAGIDTVDYSGTELSPTAVAGAQGIVVDLLSGRVFKFESDNDSEFDSVTNIENLKGSQLNDRMSGNGQANGMAGAAGNDELSGLGGKDVLSGGGGDDYLTGGDDDDRLSGDEGNDILSGDAGNDLLFGGAGNDTIDGGDGSDTMVQDLTANRDVLDGGVGEDVLDYSLTVWAAARDGMGFHGIDVDLFEGRVYKFKGQNDDLYDLVRNIENFMGTALDDVMQGNDEANGFSGGGGNDLLVGADGNDILIGDAGDDDLIGGNGDDRLMGGDGDDRLFGGAEKDVLVGGVGKDTIFAGSATDTLLQQAGPGGDELDGGADTDTAEYSNAGDATSARGIAADLAAGKVYWVDDTERQIFDTLRNIENLIATAHADRLMGDSGDNMLSGMAGNDRIEGGDGDDLLTGGEGADELLGDEGRDVLLGDAGNDTLIGGGGDDILSGGEGADSVNGGAGSDRIVQWLDTSSDLLSGGSGIDLVDYSVTVVSDSGMTGVNADLARGTVEKNGSAGSPGTDTLEEIENLIGSTGNDVLRGDSQSNVLSGAEGDDWIEGADGADVLSGGAGDDMLKGGSGSDRYLFGWGFGNDIIDTGEDGAADTIVIGEGVEVEGISLQRRTMDLVLRLNEAGNTLTVRDWYRDAANQIGQFEFSNGQRLLASDVNQLVATMADFAPPAVGESQLPLGYHSPLAPIFLAAK